MSKTSLMKHIPLYCCCLVLFLFSCPPKKGETIQAERHWGSFWALFQKKIQNEDYDGIMQLTQMNTFPVDSTDFHDFMQTHITPEFKQLILLTPAKDVSTTSDVIQAGFPTPVRVISWEEVGTNEAGEEVGSSLLLYFGKIDGEYKLLSALAVG